MATDTKQGTMLFIDDSTDLDALLPISGDLKDTKQGTMLFIDDSTDLDALLPISGDLELAELAELAAASTR